METQELFCHNCGRYVQFNLNFDRDGAQEIECPNCKHIHCRIVQDGRITEARWDSRNGQWASSSTGLIFMTVASITGYSSSAASVTDFMSTPTSATSSGIIFMQNSSTGA